MPLQHMLAETRAHALDSSVTEIDRLAIAHDASHYLLVPAGIVRPDSAEAVADIFRAASAFNLPLTFRSGRHLFIQGRQDGDGLMVGYPAVTSRKLRCLTAAKGCVFSPAPR